MITFLLVNPSRNISSIAILISIKGKQYKRGTGERVAVKKWNKTKKRIRVTADNTEANEINKHLDKWESIALQASEHYSNILNKPSSIEFWDYFDSLYFSDKKTKDNDFFPTFERFIMERDISEVRKKNYKSVMRSLRRYELYNGKKLSFDSITSDTLRDYEYFLINEHTFWNKKNPKKSYEYIYKKTPFHRKPLPRGGNTIAVNTKKIKALYNWARQNNLTDKNPFLNYEAKSEMYGTPYFITIEERDKIYNIELSQNLSIQRDIFIFQCLVGCRINDLYSFTPENIHDNILEYIPSKTINKNANTIRVPLNKTAKKIVESYATEERKTLFPFISKQKYNISIKKIFKQAEITRLVTVINPTTRKEEQRSLCDIASSHLARRTFIGNLYNKIKDPNIIGSMSGHVEGSKAFARYRAIDDEVKKSVIDLLDAE